MNKALEASLYTQATDWKKAVKEAAAMLAQLIKEKEEADKALNKAVKALDVAFTARHEVRRETAQLLEARNEYVDRNPDRATIALGRQRIWRPTARTTTSIMILPGN